MKNYLRYGDEPGIVNVLGTRVAALNPDTATAKVWELIDEGRAGRYICVTDVNGIMSCVRRPEVRSAYNSADACVPDGMPLTWIGRRRGHTAMDRVYGPDLMLRILGESVPRGASSFFYGGAEGVAEDLERRMVERYPGLKVVGTECPPFRELTAKERQGLVARLNALRPDILWVGLGAPKQELFMAEFSDDLNVPLMIGVGAAFDFHTGRVKQAPRWMMRSGLEWLFRLMVEPRRLAGRYLRNNPAFLGHLFLQQTGLRSYPTD